MGAGNIKGITIEIGGETTKLDKALKGINDKSKTIQNQLKSSKSGVETGSKEYGTTGTKAETFVGIYPSHKRKVANAENSTGTGGGSF